MSLRYQRGWHQLPESQRHELEERIKKLITARSGARVLTEYDSDDEIVVVRLMENSLFVCLRDPPHLQRGRDHGEWLPYSIFDLVSSTLAPPSNEKEEQQQATINDLRARLARIGEIAQGNPPAQLGEPN
jgi:hypothetical protein